MTNARRLPLARGAVLRERRAVTPDEYLTYDAVALAELVRTKKASPRELLAAATAILDRVNPTLNAVIHRLDDAAKAQAEAVKDGVFAGVPFLVKDLDGRLANAPWNGGSRALVGYVPKEDSELFARYRRLGLVFLGKTNTPELGILGVTEPELHGPTKNPWNTAHTPGGSSGGSAAAVAAGIVPVAHAGDGGGSIRIPASACGLFGLKPSRGRMPLGPHTGESWNGLVVPHVVSRTVRDSAAFLDATHGPDVGAPYVAPAPRGTFYAAATVAPEKRPRLKIGFTARSILGDHTHEDCRAALETAQKLCAARGHELVPIELPIDKESVRVAYLTIVAAGTALAIEDAAKLAGRPIGADDFEPVTWFLAQIGRAMSALDLERARATVFRVQREIGALFETIDVLATPTLAYPPAKIGELALKPAERIGLRALRAVPAKPVLEKALFELSKNALERTPNTMLFNMTGQPAMSMPLHVGAEGLPIGVQLVGKLGEEETLFALAAELEAAAPWSSRRPSLP